MRYLYCFLGCLQFVVFLCSCGNSGPEGAPREWRSAKILADSARYPQSGIDGQGNVVVVWAESGGFFATRYKPVTGWETPQKIGDTAPGWSDLHLAVSKNGNAVAAWLRIIAGQQTLQAVRFSAANGWGAVEDLGDHGTPNDIAITDTGAVFIVGSLDTAAISVTRYRQDSGWFFDQLPYAANSINFGPPKIALDSSGIGFVLWTEQDANEANVMVSLCGDTVLGSPEVIASGPGIITSTTLVSQNRNVMVVWGQIGSDSVSHTYARYYAASHGWEPPVQLDNSLFDCLGQSVTVDPQGNYYAIWTQRTASETANVVSAQYLPSSGWQAPELVGSSGNAVSPQIAADGSGSVFAAWQQYDPYDQFPGDAKVYSNRRVPGAGWGAPQQLKNALGGADAPTLAVAPTGRATVLWSQSVASNSGSPSYSIYWSSFD